MDTNKKLAAMPCIDSLQALRALAFLGIFMLHCEVGQMGNWGVSVFFVLSGFVMVYNYYDKSEMLEKVSLQTAFNFSVKKIKKLYGLHIFMMCIIILQIVLLEIAVDKFPFNTEFVFEIILNVFLLQSWIPQSSINYSLNGVAWYLSDCVFIYMLFPFVLQFIKRHINCKRVILFSAIIYFIQFCVGFGSSFLEVPQEISDNFCHWFTYVFPIFRVGDFIIGCNLGYIFLKRKEKKINFFLATFGEVIILGLISISMYIFVNRISFMGSEWFRGSLLFLPTSVVLVYLFAVNSGLISKILTNRLLVYIGNISAYTYLMHIMIIRCFSSFWPIVFGFSLDKWVLVLLSLITTIIVASIYNFLYKYMKNVNIVHGFLKR